MLSKNGQSGGKMTDTNPTIQRLMEANPLREPVLRAIIRALQLKTGSCGLDVGCGIGLQTLLLAEAVGLEGHVNGVDIDPELLAFGANLVARAGYSERVTFREGDMGRLPFKEGTFDWVWSADCAGYPVGDLAPILQEFKRVLQPGGSVIILAWTSQQVLPGYPLLEARLNSTCSAYNPYLKGKKPELHFLRALQGFQKAGLTEVKAQTFVGDVRAPFRKGERAALISLFEMLWNGPAPDTSPEDWE
jgi:ubiquinone/menaquinone biosynthesis C-methylase UbiE